MACTYAETFDTLPSGVVYNPFTIYLARLTHDGQLKWVRRISQRGSDGKWKSSSANDIREDTNGDILLGGSIQEPDFSFNAWFVRLSANGCLTPECVDEYVTEIGSDVFTATKDMAEVIAQAQTLKVYPNPTSDKSIIDLPEDLHDVVHYDVIDKMGRSLMTATEYINGRKLEIDLSHLAKGNYFIVLRKKDSKRFYMANVVKI